MNKAKALIIILSILALSLLYQEVIAKRYGETVCHKAKYYCYKVKSGETWHSLFPNFAERDVVMRLNRYNMRLYRGMTIAIPKDLADTNIMDISPFPTKIRPTGEKHIVVDLRKLAWGAYDSDGYLVHWGPASGGRGYCPDVGRTCRTVTGNFRIEEKQPAGCVSSVYPIASDGGAPMPFCMHFWKGYAMHGSYEVPGYNASHGCVRMFINDARWLNERFADVGTKVTVIPYKVSRQSWRQSWK